MFLSHLSSCGANEISQVFHHLMLIINDNCDDSMPARWTSSPQMLSSRFYSFQQFTVTSFPQSLSAPGSKKVSTPAPLIGSLSVFPGFTSSWLFSSQVTLCLFSGSCSVSFSSEHPCQDLQRNLSMTSVGCSHAEGRLWLQTRSSLSLAFRMPDLLRTHLVLYS